MDDSARLRAYLALYRACQTRTFAHQLMKRKQRTQRIIAEDTAKATMNRIGNDLLRDAKANLSENGASKDLLSLLVRANAEEKSERGQTITDEEVLARESLDPEIFSMGL